jgi:Tol biopolymer transport system component
VWFDRSGKELGGVGAPGDARPALSPDGRYVAVAKDSSTGQSSIWIHDLQRNIPTQFTTSGTDTAHVWSPDGRWIAYSGMAMRASSGLFRRPADGSSTEEKLLESAAHLLVNSYSGDGRKLLFMDFGNGTPELRVVDIESRKTEVIDAGAEGVFSPDGRWIAYIDYLNGMLVVKSMERGTRLQVSPGAGSQARWRADMKELFYIAPDKKMMSVPLTIHDGVLEAGTPVQLFQTRIIQPRMVLFQYDTRDGQRFLINSLPREDAAAPLTVLVNWTAELGR